MQTTMTVTKLCALLDSCIAELGNLKSQIGVNEEFLKLAGIADKRAREECCEIIRNERVANECACESDEAYNLALTHAEQAIRATIQEPQP